MDVFEVAGVVGVLATLAAYLAVQLHRLQAVGVTNLTMNFVGSSLILVSLSQHFNLSAALIEGAWAAISLFGLARALLRPR
jgi:uncharacterized membrane-anchored protein